MKPKLITKLGRERMRTMIAYLRVLKPELFDFDTIAKQGHCGTVGCVIGHTPVVFPGLCEYQRDGDYLRVGSPGTGKWEGYSFVGARVFGLAERTAVDLFTPDLQPHQRRFGVDVACCEGNAKPTEVADMLESFLSQVDDIEVEEVAL